MIHLMQDDVRNGSELMGPIVCHAYMLSSLYVKTVASRA
jgi:hypothetical protein